MIQRQLISKYKKIFNNKINLKNINVNILFLISNYERKDMLMELLSEIEIINKNPHINIDYKIFDDQSSYELEDKNFIINTEHRGKKYYWKTFNEMFNYCRNKKQYDIFVFTPNDFLKYNFFKLIEYGINLKNEFYIFNIINDGRTSCWTHKKPILINDDVRLQFFSDCGFFTNYKTLRLLNFKINPIHLTDKNLLKYGSRVGKQISDRSNRLNIKTFTPLKSIAYHGDHESLMNKEERKKNKLISI